MVWGAEAEGGLMRQSAKADNLTLRQWSERVGRNRFIAPLIASCAGSWRNKAIAPYTVLRDFSVKSAPSTPR
jgi:hypothetical protein